MKTLYLECNMGAAGDMLMAALWELLPDRDGFLKTMNGLGLPGVAVRAEPAVRCGISGTHMAVTVHGHEEGDHHEHHHHHSTLADIHHAISHLPVSAWVKDNAKAVYDRIAAAESQVHGQPVEAVHFHEVGAWDAVADVVGVCLALELLKPDEILASPVHVGCGQVRCAHGLLPVPAPATALLLRGVPVYGGQVQGELCTPTGAALLTQFVTSFGGLPVMTIEKTGCGMGAKEFDRANCVRAHWGTRDQKRAVSLPPSEEGGGPEGRRERKRCKSQQAALPCAESAGSLSQSALLTAPSSEGAVGALNSENLKEVILDEIAELTCNLDDMTGEAVGFAMERLWEHGALDVFTTPIGMKKSRPGIMLTVLCKKEDARTMADLLLRHTSTLGVRENTCRRYTLPRRMEIVETKYGPVRVKRAGAKAKAEYEDLARIARENGLTLEEARREVGP